MAITKVGTYRNPPETITDYEAIVAHLEAYTRQIGNQGMILTEWANTSGTPAIAMGSYISHGGVLYVVSSEEAVSLPVADGTYYLKVAASGDTLALSWVSDISGYAWNAIANGLYHADESQVLPYMLVVAGAVVEKWKITNLMQGSGFSRVRYDGAVKCESLAVTGAISGASLITLLGPNKPADNNDASMPSVGIGGFSYAIGSTSTSGTFPSITIGSGGTWVYIANTIDSGSSTSFRTVVGRIAGGSTVQGSFGPSPGSTASVLVIAWRIA